MSNILIHDGEKELNEIADRLVSQHAHLQDSILEVLDEIESVRSTFYNNLSTIQQKILKISKGNNHFHTELLHLTLLSKPEKSTSVTESDLYDLPAHYADLSLWAKIRFFMNDDDEWQSASELLAKILEAEPRLKEEQLKRKINLNLYATLNSKHKGNEILREKINGEFVYTLPRKEGQAEGI